MKIFGMQQWQASNVVILSRKPNWLIYADRGIGLGGQAGPLCLHSGHCALGWRLSKALTVRSPCLVLLISLTTAATLFLSGLIV